VSHTTTLNANQARRVRTHLELLAEQLAAEAASLPSGPAGERVRRGIDRAQHDIRRVLDACRLEPLKSVSRSRRLMAVAEAWLARLDDLRPRALGAYGTPPTDGTALNERLDDLATALHIISQAAREVEA